MALGKLRSLVSQHGGSSVSVKVAHLTSAHPRFDTRIFVKECRSLVKAGYQVSLVVADGLGDAHVDGVVVLDVGAPRGRLQRMRHTTRMVRRKAVELDADIYHLHDPELMPTGLALRRLGKQVIFDAHEDLPKQLLTKPYLNAPARRLLSLVFGYYEARACRQFNAVVGATPFIRDKFLHINPNTVDVNNYPVLGELSTAENKWENKRKAVCYVGGLGSTRGIREIIRAIELVDDDTQLLIGGKFGEADLEREVKQYPGWRHVVDRGWLDRKGVRKVLQQSMAGLVTLHPTQNYLDALPVKMFEYMSAGIPVIASAFPLWESIIKKANCGICVDPLDPKAIAEAIITLTTQPNRAQIMGRNGQQAVRERYNWDIEEQKLLSLYSKIAAEAGLVQTKLAHVCH